MMVDSLPMPETRSGRESFEMQSGSGPRIGVWCRLQPRLNHGLDPGFVHDRAHAKV